jgi:hypothetical protein
VGEANEICHRLAHFWTGVYQGRENKIEERHNKVSKADYMKYIELLRQQQLMRQTFVGV